MPGGGSSRHRFAELQYCRRASHFSREASTISTTSTSAALRSTNSIELFTRRSSFSSSRRRWCSRPSKSRLGCLTSVAVPQSGASPASVRSMRYSFQIKRGGVNPAPALHSYSVRQFLLLPFLRPSLAAGTQVLDIVTQPPALVQLGDGHVRDLCRFIDVL